MRIGIAAPTLLLATLLASASSAQVITGRVVSSTGVGVLGVNIDGFDSSDNEIDLANDGTDANGNFTTTVVSGAGVYRFVFYPPAPPQTTHLVGERDSVVVVTTTNLGTITLGAGVLLTGRAVQAGSIPVANVPLQVIDGLSGNAVLQDQDKTNAFGQFNLAVPLHASELRLDASGFVLGSRAFSLDPSGPVALGDILLPQAATVTGHVQRSNGTPVDGADLDFEPVAGGAEPYVPDDNSDVAGNFSVVVALGTYDISFCPNPADRLVTQLLSGQAITTTTNLGTIVVGDGLRLFGTVLDQRGAPAGNVDVDVFVSASGAPVPLCNDNTNAGGVYSVFVPIGTHDVVFTRSGGGYAIGGDWHRNVAVNADTQLDGMLARGYGHSVTGPLHSGGTVVVPLVTSWRPHRPLGAPPPGGAPSPVVLTGAEHELQVEGLAPGRRALVLAGSEGSPTFVWALPGTDSEGRTSFALARLPASCAWLRVISPGGGGASALLRLPR